jgi:hypothetical protein
VKRLFALLPLTLFLAACAGTGEPAPPPGPPPLNLVGVYECTMSGEGQELPMTMTFSGSEGAYTGSIDTEMGGATMEDIAVDGNLVTFWVSPDPNFSIYFALDFEGDSFTGTLDGGEFVADVYGKKR